MRKLPLKTTQNVSSPKVHFTPLFFCFACPFGSRLNNTNYPTLHYRFARIISVVRHRVRWGFAKKLCIQTVPSRNQADSLNCGLIFTYEPRLHRSVASGSPLWLLGSKDVETCASPQTIQSPMGGEGGSVDIVSRLNLKRTDTHDSFTLIYDPLRSSMRKT